MAEKTLAKTGKWTTGATWSPEGAPALTDEVNLNGSSFNLEVTAASKCRNLEAETYKGTLNITGTNNITIGDATAPVGNVALRFGSLMTFSPSEGARINFNSSSTTQLKIFCGGQKICNVKFETKGNYILEDKMEKRSGECALTHANGTLNTNGQEVILSALNGEGSLTRTLTLGASIIKIIAITPYWNMAGATNLTLNANTSTIEVSQNAGDGVATPVFNGGGKTFNTVTFLNSGAEIIGANTFATLNVNIPRKPTTVKGTLVGGSTTLTVTEGTGLIIGDEIKGTGTPNGTTILKSLGGGTWEMSAAATETISTPETIEIFPIGLIFKQGETQTVETLATTGTESEPARICSSESGKQWKIKRASGTIEVSHLIIRDSKAEGGATFKALNGSRDAGNNTGWSFNVVNLVEVAVSQVQSLLLGKLDGAIKSPTQSQLVSYLRAITTERKATQNQAGAIQKTPTHIRSATQTQAATRAAALGRFVSPVAESIVSMAPRGITRLTSATQAASTVVQREQTRLITVTQSGVASTLKFISKLYKATQEQLAFSNRSASRLLEVTAGSTSSLAKSSGRTVTPSQTSAALVQKVAQRAFQTSQATLISISEKFGLSKVLELVQATIPESLKQVNSSTFSVTQVQVVTMLKAVPRIVTFLVIQTVTPALERSFARIVKVTQGVSITSPARAINRFVNIPVEVLGRVNRLLTRKPFKVEQTQEGRLGIGRIYPKFILTASTVATSVKGPGRAFLATQAQTLVPSIRKIFRIALATAGAQAAITERALSRKVTNLQAQIVTMSKSSGHPILISLTVGVAVKVGQALSKGLPITVPQTVKALKNLPRPSFNIGVPSSIQIAKTFGKEMRLTQGTLILNNRFFLRIVAIVQTLIPTAGRSFARNVTLSVASVLKIKKSPEKEFLVPQGRVLSIVKSVKRAIAVPAGHSLTIAREATRNVIVAQTQTISVQVARGYNRVLEVVQASVIASKHVLEKTLGLEQEIAITLPRFLTKRIEIVAPVIGQVNRLIPFRTFVIKQFQLVTFAKSKVYFKTLEVAAATVIKFTKGFVRQFFLDQPQNLLGTHAVQRNTVVSGTLTWVIGTDKIVSPALLFEDGGTKVVANLKQFKGVLTPGTPDTLTFVLEPPKTFKPGSTKDPRWQ